MNLTPMRYKSYTWPHNPRVYTIDFRRPVAVHKMPFGRYYLQDLGMSQRVMEGEGEFVGSGAYEEFQRLASVFYEDGPGLLVHPLWQAANAYFVSLRVEQAPRPDYVRYSFTFWEDYSLYSALASRANGSASNGSNDSNGSNGSAAESGAAQPNSQAAYHQVVRGDTLWALAKRYGVTLTELLALNPQIKNPNLIRVGEEVRVR